MKGDFTRFSFDPDKHYTGVRKQQGRVDLDADWNEAVDIRAYLDALQSRDVIGECGMPKKTAGFQVSVKPDGSDLELSSGRLYVKGRLCAAGAASYLKQPYLPDPPELDPKDDRTDLVYLEVWQRHITAVEDPDLLEPALGGADTTTRVQTIWQVKVRQDVKAIDCKGEVGTWPPVPPLDQRGRLSTSVSIAPTTTSPCLISPGGGYRGLENRLYRVEIHDAGQPYSKSRPASVVSTAVTSVPGKFKVIVADWSHSGSAWNVGQTVEMYSQETDAAGGGGTLARITALAKSTKTITLDTDISSMSGHTDLKLRRVATYKWSRDNGSIVFPIQEFVNGEPAKVKVARLGRDQVLTLHPEDWVEVLGDSSELWGRPGTLAAIATGGIDEAEMKLTLSRSVAAHSEEAWPKVRRWDQKSTALAVTEGETELEDGIKIKFVGEELQSGDYWCFAARTATGEVDILNAAPPMGIERSFCKLALIHWKKGVHKLTPWDESTVTLCPPTFPPLSDIWAEDVFYDDSRCTSIQAETVQEAIDQLCAQRNLPHHNKHLHGWGIVCGLRVVCGPEDLETPGDQRSVVVKPGYALDCEGQDIVLEQEMQVAVFDMIEAWKKENPNAAPLLTEKDGKLSGDVLLTIERDENGAPRLGLRRYDPSADNLKTMLQGTLLMDFIQKCIAEPLKEIQDFLQKPTGDFDKGSIVKPQRQQFIAIFNLLIQLFKAQYGPHVFLSQKEHEILENLYYKLAEILASQTFCGMFHEDLFPDYPFPRHDMTTLFGRDAYRRMRIHPGGKLGYVLGTKNSIGVFDLETDILIEELAFPGEGLSVQDVAFSAKGDTLYAVALSSGGDSLFASAKIKGNRHTWQPVKPVCGLSLMTLANTSHGLYAIARDDGLYVFNPDQEVIRPDRIGESFHAVGHLVVDVRGLRAYATAAQNSKKAISGVYHSVLGIRLAGEGIGTAQSFSLLEALSGQDDIAVSFESNRLFVVADPPPNRPEDDKTLVVFNTSNPNNQLAAVDLEANTTIRLLPLADKPYLVIAYEDCYWLRLMDIEKRKLLEAFHLPVQVSPIDLVLDPVLENPRLRDKQAQLEPGARKHAALRIYVLNALSSTVTAFPAGYLLPKATGLPRPLAGSDAFLEKLMAYRQEVLRAFLGLFGAVWQSLKDCLCDRFLVDCPTCDADDDIYLARINIKESEVYQVCNFSKRKYVKSFPTLEYWLSVLPILPLIDKAIEKFCCAILPPWFLNWGKKPVEVKVKGVRMRQSYAFMQQQGMKTTYQRVMNRTLVARNAALDWTGQSLARAVMPPERLVSQEELVGTDITAAQERLQAANVEVASVETYDPAQGFQNMQRISSAPADLRQGAKVTLYEENGVVRYYAVAQEPSPRIAAMEQELKLQKESLENIKLQAAAPAEVVSKVVAAGVPTAELQALKNELKVVKEQAMSKDLELSALRTKLESLEKKQSADLASLQKKVNRLSKK